MLFEVNYTKIALNAGRHVHSQNQAKIRQEAVDFNQLFYRHQHKL